jgi:hypothetical protein
MSLIRRKPKKRIRISKAAELIGCSSESIRTGAVGKFRMFKLNPDKTTSPWMMYESELNDYLERTEARAA